MSTPDDLDRDAWLRQALRHAPDADAAPPAALSAAILAQAHAQVGSEALADHRCDAPQATPFAGWGARVMAAWRWLAQPPVAAGFASVLLATVVGVMWWGQPLEQALPRESAAASPEVQRERLAQASDPPVTPITAAPRAEEAPPSPAAPRMEVQRREQATPQRAVANTEQGAARSEAKAAAVTTPAQTTASTKTPEAALPAATTAAATADASSPPPVTIAAAPPAVAKPSIGKADVEGQAATEATQSRSSTTAALRDATGNASPASASAFSLRSVPAPGPASWLSQPQVSLHRWSWQMAAGPRQPMTAALASWLAQLEGFAGQAWVTLAPIPSASEPQGGTLTLWRDERAHARLRLEAEYMRIDSIDAASGQVLASHAKALSPAQSQALRQALDALTR